MSDRAALIYPASDAFVRSAHIDAEGYARAYAASITDPDAFWA